MSTKNVTSSNFAPGALSNYGTWSTVLQSLLPGMAANPTTSQFFNQNLQQNQKAASQIGGVNASNALTNFNRSGIGQGTGGGGAMQSLLAGTGRYNSNLRYQAWNSTMNTAQSNQWNAINAGSNFFGNPLRTGQTQTTSGTGTWLPQLLGAGLGAAAGIATGGASTGIGALFAKAGLGQPAGGPGQGDAGSMQPSMYNFGSTLTPPSNGSSFVPGGGSPLQPGMSGFGSTSFSPYGA